MSLHDFLSKPFDKEKFKQILTQIFPSVNFLAHELTQSLDSPHLKGFTQLCEPLNLGAFKLGIGIFETTSIRAKISIHSEILRLLKSGDLSGILCVFYENPKKSPAIAPADLGGGLFKNTQNSVISNENSSQIPQEFRLSLITTGFDYERNKTTYSNLKRHSFILGHDKIATAQKALQKLIDKAQNAKSAQIQGITLADLQEAFAQEPLNQAFFDDYKKHFELICARLENAGLDNAFARLATSSLGAADKAAARKRIEAFAKKLMGRIVFLYFLQKKGWLGVGRDKTYGEGQRDFITAQFKIAAQKGANFYLDYLCPLFFDSLNKEREGDYSPHFECKIPFLNGGLFEDEFAIKGANSPSSQGDKATKNSQKPTPNSLNSTQNSQNSINFTPNSPHFLISQVLDNAVFKNLLDFLDAYNFTLEESSPQDIEISIDPEMLGKVFENLIDYNKQSGAFYTPREIVSYMAQSAILAYLQRHFTGGANELESLICRFETDNDFIRKNAAAIKNALLSVKILDPAIGSGAFPMGVLLEIMQILSTLDKTLTNHDKAVLKRRLIQECIYGLDIDADAIDIARLRFWLSIAVDEAAPQPLPNLDFKFMQGNSLLESLSVGDSMLEIIPKEFLMYNNGTLFSASEIMPKDESNALFSASEIMPEEDPMKKELLKEDKIETLQKSFKDYFKENNAKKKQNIKKDILKILQDAFNDRKAEVCEKIENLKKDLNTGLNKPKNAQKLKVKIESLNFLKENLEIEFNALLKGYELNNFASDKLFLYRFFFAEVMQNGGFDIVIGNPPYGAKISESDKKAYKMHYKHAILGSIDTYKLFIEKGFNLLKINGYLSFIVPITITSSKSNTNLHKMLLANCEQIVVSSYSDTVRIFQNADQAVSIIGFVKTLTPCQSLLTTGVNKRYSTQSVASVIEKMSFVNSLDFVRDGAFCKIARPIEKAIMQKLYAQKFTLKDFMQGAERVYYRTSGGRYYKIYTSYSTNSSKETSFAITDSKAFVALLSSTLFWWFRNSYSDDYNVYLWQFEQFPIPKFSDETLSKLRELGELYENDIEKNTDFSNGVKTYKIRKSKHIIDQIDRLICPLYALTPTETEFIINYELEFRTDNKGE